MVQIITENEPDLLENLKIFVSGRGRPRKPRQSQVDCNSYASFFSNAKSKTGQEISAILGT